MVGRSHWALPIDGDFLSQIDYVTITNGEFSCENQDMFTEDKHLLNHLQEICANTNNLLAAGFMIWCNLKAFNFVFKEQSHQPDIHSISQLQVRWNQNRLPLFLLMLGTILLLLIAILPLKALISYIRRRTAKPNYTNKIVWLTGASSGIGEYLAYEFNQCGAFVIISARSIQELERVKASCPHPENVEVLPLNISEFQQTIATTQKLIERLESQGKRIDIVVESVGQSMISEFTKASLENHLRVYDVNMHGPFVHLQTLVPHFIKHKGGQIVGISSLCGRASIAFRSSYNGSKVAFQAFLDTIRSELGPSGIHVCNIMPGYIQTGLSKKAFLSEPGTVYGRVSMNMKKDGMAPDVFAKEALGAIYNQQNEASIHTGWIPTVISIFRNLMPDLVFAILKANVKTQRKIFEEEKTQ